MRRGTTGLSLQYQVAIGIGLTMLVVVVATVWGVQALDKRETRRILNERAEEAIKQFVLTTENDAIAIGNRGKLEESTTAAVDNMPDLAYVRIENRDGRVIAEAGVPLPAEAEPIRRERDYVVSGERFATVLMEWSPQRWLERASVVSLRTALLVGGALLLLGLLAVIVLHRIAIRPIDMIEKRLAARSPDGYIPPLELKGAPELVRVNLAIDQLNEEHSQRLDLQDRLRQSQKMEAVGRLAGGIAHNFNNVLMVVLGYSELLRARLNDDPSVAKALGAIEQSVNHASSLTSQLLSLSQSQPQRAEVIDACSVMRNMRSLLEPTLGAQITIDLDCDSAPKYVDVDLALLESAILNLAANARDAMPDGGSLMIRCTDASFDECCRANLDPNVGGVLIEVVDDGVGMNAEVQEHIFDPFFTTKAPDEGTGLGLATVFTFVEQSGGIVEVRSALGVGTIFKIILPKVSDGVSISSRGRTEVPIQSNGGYEVLLVEDDPSVQSLLAEHLRGLGFVVVTASDAAEGELAFGDGERFDVLVTDVGLPDRSGPELATELRKRNKDLSIVFVTGHVDAAAERVLNSVGRATMLRKPFSLEVLGSSIEQALELTGGTPRLARKKDDTRLFAR